MATLSLQDLENLPPTQKNVLSLDDLAALDPKTPSKSGKLSWSDVPSQAIRNIPTSAYNLAAGVANTVMHPIDTAQGLYDVGKGAVSKAAGAIGVEQDPETKTQNEAAIDAVGQFFADRYGGIENFKKTMAEDPVGFAMDLSTVLSGGGAAAARIPGAARVANTVRKAAEWTNPVGVVGKATAATGDRVIAPILGETTGVGATPIRQAFRAGENGNRTFTDNMRGNVPFSDAVGMAQSAIGGLRRDRSAAYQTDMAAANSATGHVGYQPIHKALADADQMVNFQGLAKSAEAAKTLEQIQNLVGQWRGLSTPHTVEAADALKQAIGEIRQKTQPGTLERRVADTVYNAAKDSIVRQAPNYAKAMQRYSEASDTINELTKTFSLGEKASIDTALRKLQSTTRNNVNTNYGQRTKLLDELAQYAPDLPEALAGQSLSTATPRGINAKTGAFFTLGGSGAAHGMSLLNPTTIAMAPFFSPRLMGEAAYAGGRVSGKLAPFLETIPQAAKAGYVGGLFGGIGPRYDDFGNLRQ